MKKIKELPAFTTPASQGSQPSARHSFCDFARMPDGRLALIELGGLVESAIAELVAHLVEVVHASAEAQQTSLR